MSVSELSTSLKSSAPQICTIRNYCIKQSSICIIYEHKLIIFLSLFIFLRLIYFQFKIKGIFSGEYFHFWYSYIDLWVTTSFLMTKGVISGCCFTVRQYTLRIAIVNNGWPLHKILSLLCYNERGWLAVLFCSYLTWMLLRMCRECQARRAKEGVVLILLCVPIFRIPLTFLARDLSYLLYGSL